MRVCTSMLLLVALLSETAFCVTNDWPQFRGHLRNGRSHEHGLLESWPVGGPELLWTFEGLGTGFASVAVVEGSIYTTGMMDGQGYLFAIDAGTGELKYKKHYGAEWTGSYPGARTTPTVDGDRLYLMSGRGRIACYKRETGRLVWEVDTLEKFGGENIKWGIAESVLINGNDVYCTPGGKDATMVALNKYSGETVWTTKGLSALSSYCSPIFLSGNNVLVTMVRGFIICVRADTGEVLWTIPHETSNNIAAVTPLRCYENRVYLTSHAKGGTMLRLVDGGAKYEALWKSDELDPLHGGVLFDTEGTPSLYGADTKGNWVRQNASTGELIFKEKLIEGKGSIAYADGRLYCYSEKGTIGLVEPTKEGMKLVSSFAIEKGDGKHWGHPAISNAVLYIRHGDALLAFDIKGPARNNLDF